MLQTDRCATSRLSEVEVVSALARRSREGALGASDRDRLLRTLASDVLSLVVVEVSEEITRWCYDLLLRHPLRAADAIHLASALYLQRELKQTVVFVAFDERLNRAAHREGLQIVSGRP